VAQLQALPWRKAEEFLQGDRAVEAFENYAASGSGISVLKTRFAAHQADIIARWNELTAWVAQQIAATAPPKTDLVFDKSALAKLPVMPVIVHYLAATMSAEITDDYWELITKHSRGINGGMVTKTVLPLGKAESNEFLILLSSTGEQLVRGNGQGGTRYSLFLCTGKDFKNLDEVMAEQNQDLPLNLEGHGVRDGNRIYFARTYPPRPVRSWVVEFGLRNGQFFYQQADIAAGAVPEKVLQRFFKREHIQEWSAATDPFPTEEITLAELIRSPSPQWHAELDDETAIAQAKDLTAQEFRDWLRKMNPPAKK